jgi:hypothetical protein
MARRKVQAGTAWQFPAAGFALATLMAVAPGSPLAVEQWPVRGPFGAFTWLACASSTALGLTLLLLAPATRRHRGNAGRIAMAAAAFGLLALGAYTAAARADRIERNPLVALAIAVAGLVLLRIVAGRLTEQRTPAPGQADLQVGAARASTQPLNSRTRAGWRSALTGLALAVLVGVSAAALLVLGGGVVKLASMPTKSAKTPEPAKLRDHLIEPTRNHQIP